MPDGGGECDPSPFGLPDAGPVPDATPVARPDAAPGEDPDTGTPDAEIRIANTSPSGQFAVCFPIFPSTPPDFTGSVPWRVGAAGAADATTPYIPVPAETAYMRFVAAGATDCSTRIDSRTDDSIGPFSATPYRSYTVHVDGPDYSYSSITVD